MEEEHNQSWANRQTPDIDPNVAGFFLRVEDLIVWVPEMNNFRHKVPKKAILKGINLELRPGTMTAIVGPSGSGKTTLLNFLAGRQDTSQNFRTSCQYYLNGHEVKDLNNFKNIIGYVTQDDILETRHTPRKAFTYYAKLRGQPDPVKSAQSVIEVMHLQGCSETVIGDVFIRGLSGGEKKRTSIGIELISNPRLLFLDEPTTGLDSATALDIIMNIAELRSKGMTVAATLHQPSEELLALFDRVLFLVDGMLCFGGNPLSIESRLRSLNIHKTKFEQPLEAFMKAVDKDDIKVLAMQKNKMHDEETIKKIHMDRISELTSAQDKIDRSEYTPPVPSKEGYEKLIKISRESNQMLPFLSQVWLIFYNYFYLFNSQPRGLLMRLFMISMNFIFLILVFIITPDPKDNPFVSIQNYAGFFFMCTINSFMGGNSTAATLLMPAKPLFRKDNQARVYSRAAYFMGISASVMPFYLIVWCIMSIVYFFVFRLNQIPMTNLLWYIAFINVSNLAGGSFGMLLSALAEKYNDISALMPLVVMPMNVVSGFFANVLTITWPLRILSYVAPTRFAFQGIVLNHFRDRNLYLQNCKIEIPCLDNQSENCIYYPPPGTTMSNQCDPFVRFNFEQKEVWLNFLIACILFVAWRIIAFIVFLWRYRERYTIYEHDPEYVNLYSGRINGRGTQSVKNSEEPIAKGIKINDEQNVNFDQQFQENKEIQPYPKVLSLGEARLLPTLVTEEF